MERIAADAERAFRRSDPLPELVVGGPETIFGVTDLSFDGPTARASMPVTGALVRSGGITAGSLGVLIDIALGYALVAARPPGFWSVSSEIAVEALGGLRSARGRLRAEAEVVDVDALGGLARGRVFDDTGELVALCSQRGRFVPVPVGGTSASAGGYERLPAGGELLDLIGAEQLPSDQGARLQFVASDAVTNPLGNLHGGIGLCCSDLAAHLALGSSNGPWATTSLQTSYVRPVPGGAQVEFRATARHRGRGLAVVDVDGVVDGRLCTIARVTLQPPEPPAR
jgi:uncharacterized protein (TIGR00369 family)